MNISKYALSGKVSMFAKTFLTRQKLNKQKTLYLPLASQNQVLMGYF